MPGLYEGDIQANPGFQDRGLDFMSLPWGDALAANARHMFVTSPVQELGDISALAYAQQPESRSIFEGFRAGQGELAGDPSQLFARLSGQQGQQVADGSDRFIDPHTLNQKYGKSIGLSFDRPTRSGAVDIMVARRRRDIDLAARLDHAPDSLTFQGVNLLTSLAVGATDPLNIASAFVPVVGEARFGLWTARYGKTLARVGEGAIEGAVGQAILEPLNIATERAYGNEYGPMDSFLNVAFGTVLGGGLHVGFGAISDLMGRVTPETREQTLRAAVAQMAEGRDVDVAHVVYSDPAFRRLDTQPIIQDLRFAADEARIGGEHATLTEQINALPEGTKDARARLDRLEQFDITEREFGGGITPEQRAEIQAQRAEVLGESALENQQAIAKQLEERRGLEDRLSQLEKDLSGVRSKRLELKVQDSLTPEPMRGIARTAVERIKGMESAQAAPALQQSAVNFAGAADTRVRETIDRARSNTVDASKGDAPGIAGEKPGKTAETVKLGQGDDLEAEVLEASRRVDEFEKQGIVTPEEAEKVRGTDARALASKRSKAADAAARCLLLHP